MGAQTSEIFKLVFAKGRILDFWDWKVIVIQIKNATSPTDQFKKQ